jgi:hypothetical protein
MQASLAAQRIPQAPKVASSDLMMHGMDMSPADTACDFPNPVDPAIQGPLPPAISSGPFAFATEDEATMEYTAAVGHLRGTLRHAELPEYTVLCAPPLLPLLSM